MFTARKPMTIEGERYAAGDPVDISTLHPALRQKLVNQRRVVPLEAESLSEGGEPNSEVVAEPAPDVATEPAPEVVPEPKGEAVKPKPKVKRQRRKKTTTTTGS